MHEWWRLNHNSIDWGPCGSYMSGARYSTSLGWGYGTRPHSRDVEVGLAIFLRHSQIPELSVQGQHIFGTYNQRFRQAPHFMSLSSRASVTHLRLMWDVRPAGGVYGITVQAEMSVEVVRTHLRSLRLSSVAPELSQGQLSSLCFGVTAQNCFKYDVQFLDCSQSDSNLELVQHDILSIVPGQRTAFAFRLMFPIINTQLCHIHFMLHCVIR